METFCYSQAAFTRRKQLFNYALIWRSLSGVCCVLWNHGQSYLYFTSVKMDGLPQCFGLSTVIQNQISV
ncbi:hypothetical protein ONE63_001008 [Megalurothrips usitatus]|uniref:Uncharacterized protein n=1 Tax=Megalurothrips usitatus TaxID=439358 RepID=A0AAV7XH32_9NEOP|nr:hypothetical protein ONE63_001008 [Megalurothrips usitatus]